ncbi:MAG: RrF2 family transcriptional regulator [Candidatus Methylomirabilia bacterium]
MGFVVELRSEFVLFPGKMRITLEADYAVRVMLELARRPEGELVPTDRLSRRTGVPRAYLTKIVQSMARAGLVRTRRGARGGVRLVRKPARVTLRQVIEAIDGPVYLNRCVVGPGECPRDRFCPVQPAWQRIQAKLMRELDAVTMAVAASPRDGSRKTLKRSLC